MKHISKAQLVHQIITMDKGENIYINAIGLTVNAVEKLKMMIKNGAIIPNRKEAEKMYKDIESVMSGDVILPQMTYTRA